MSFIDYPSYTDTTADIGAPIQCSVGRKRQKVPTRSSRETIEIRTLPKATTKSGGEPVLRTLQRVCHNIRVAPIQFPTYG